MAPQAAISPFPSSPAFLASFVSPLLRNNSCVCHSYVKIRGEGKAIGKKISRRAQAETTLCFHTLTNCLAANNFSLILIQIARGWRATIPHPHALRTICARRLPRPCRGVSSLSFSGLPSRRLPPSTQQVFFQHSNLRRSNALATSPKVLYFQYHERFF
jgi:hypothetical protein